VDTSNVNWSNVVSVPPKGFVCGFCNHYMSSNHGWPSSWSETLIYLCSYCNRPNFFEVREGGQVQTPGAAFGGTVERLPGGVGALYDEARNCAAGLPE
jgi:hypothetical protein